MKKIFACTLIALGCMAGTAQASTEVHFLGSVNAITCDLVPDVGGAINKTIPLGTVAPSAQGSIVDFALKPDGNNISGCAALDSTNKVSVAWGGNSFDANGLRNVSGDAVGSTVKLLHKNASEGGNTPITANQLLTSVDGDVLKANGLLYSAQLTGGTTPGTFIAAAAYSVAYN